MNSLFDCDKPYFAAWVGVYNIDESSMWMIPNPLYYVSLCGFSDLVEQLAIKHPEHVDAFGGRYRFPLFAALAGKHFRAAEILLQHGASIDSQGMRGRSLLHEAVRDVNVVRSLLNYGANINCQQDDLRTPLHLAVRHREFKVARVLVEHKADVNSQSEWLDIPIRLLFQDHDRDGNGILDLARLLLERGADEEALLHKALLKYKAYVDFRDDRDRTPLRRLIVESYRDCSNVLYFARLLLDHGADTNIRTMDEWTLLHSAVFRGRREFARLLLDYGTNANSENKRGETPLHLVLRGDYDEEEDRVAVAQLLLEHGGDVNARTKNNPTPSDSAISYGRLEIAQVLLEHGTNTCSESENWWNTAHEVLFRFSASVSNWPLLLIWPIVCFVLLLLVS